MNKLWFMSMLLIVSQVESSAGGGAEASSSAMSQDQDIKQKLQALEQMLSTELQDERGLVKPASTLSFVGLRNLFFTDDESKPIWLKVLKQHESTMREHFIGTAEDKPFWTEMFDKAEGANCGYHALKNATIFLQAYYSGNKEFLTFLNSIKTYQHMVRPWIVEIQRKNLDSVGGDSSLVLYPLGNMIIGADIEHLIAKFMPQFQNDITVVDSFEVFENPAKMSEVQFDLLKKLSTSQNIIQAFIVNTDALKPADSMGRGFHWVVYVLLKINGQPKIVFMDSMMSINQEMVKKIKHLATLSVDELKQLKQAWHEEMHIKPALQNIEQMKNRLAGKDDMYLYQGGVAQNCSLATVQFSDLDLAAILSDKNPEEQQAIQQAFERSFPEWIQELKKPVQVEAIEGVSAADLEHMKFELQQLRNQQMAARSPEKSYVFTFWQSSKTGRWEVLIEQPSDVKKYLETCSKQYGKKGTGDKDLTRHDFSPILDVQIAELLSEIKQLMSYDWSTQTIEQVLQAVIVITHYFISYPDLKGEFWSTLYIILEKVKDSVQAMSGDISTVQRMLDELEIFIAHIQEPILLQIVQEIIQKVEVILHKNKA